MIKLLNWAGREDQDTALDVLDVAFWASIQLYRCSEKARHQGAPQPTFTGVQVQERLIKIDAKIDAKKREIVTAAKIHAMHVRKAQTSQEKLQEDERELKEYELAREELRDLDLIAWSLL
ncbi:hypothetical protein BT96DRAFT_936232 [Gymnopus androsaceus JB14]|uniref:Uncharacterized protein n=1 Tax=Gymnopus androsaceus JB14 TaxID=1447944 RepID=A0A6A4HZU9_9AGAR|nr:hypothetical protein BT96DRAFT_936232 [Gymnopus androsaceus JB14]